MISLIKAFLEKTISRATSRGLTTSGFSSRLSSGIIFPLVRQQYTYISITRTPTRFSMSLATNPVILDNQETEKSWKEETILGLWPRWMPCNKLNHFDLLSTNCSFLHPCGVRLAFILDRLLYLAPDSSYLGGGYPSIRIVRFCQRLFGPRSKETNQPALSLRPNQSQIRKWLLERLQHRIWGQNLKEVYGVEEASFS